jgi:hypothetical protein
MVWPGPAAGLGLPLLLVCLAGFPTPTRAQAMSGRLQLQFLRDPRRLRCESNDSVTLEDSYSPLEGEHRREDNLPNVARHGLARRGLQ